MKKLYQKIIVSILSLAVMGTVCAFAPAMAEASGTTGTTGTTTVAATTDSWWMGNDKTAAQANAGDYIAKALNVVGGNRLTAGSDVFVGYQMKKSTDSATSYIVLKDPDGAYLKNLIFYAYYRGTSASDACIVSVSDTLAGPYTTVSTVSTKRVGKLNNTETHSIWKHTVTDIEAKYVKITTPTTTGSGYPIIGAFSYDWIKLHSTKKCCATTNPYWLADSIDDVFTPFVEYTVFSNETKASVEVTAEDIAKGGIVGNPVKVDETAFIGVNGGEKHAIVEAPVKTSITRVKYYVYSVGSDAGIAGSLSVSDALAGEYEPVEVSITKLGRISGRADNHFLYEVETVDAISCKYVKFTVPSAGYAKIGAFEYDYMSDKLQTSIDSAVDNGTAVTATATVSNLGLAEDASMELIVAGYDGDRFMGAQTKTVTKADEDGTDSLTVTLPTGTKTVKVFLWKDLDTLVPVLDPIDAVVTTASAE